MQSAYERSLRWSLRHRGLVLGVFALSLVATVVLFRVMPEDFLPSEDTGQLTAYTEGANGISFEEMRRHQLEAAQLLWSDPNIQGAMSSVGSGGARGGSNQGSFRITLKPTDERLPIDQIMAELRRKFAQIPGLNVFIQNRPVITIGGLISKADTNTRCATPTRKSSTTPPRACAPPSPRRRASSMSPAILISRRRR